jgi:hypothetical protein
VGNDSRCMGAIDMGDLILTTCTVCFSIVAITHVWACDRWK